MFSDRFPYLSESARALDNDALLLSGLLVLSSDVQDAVGVDVEGDLDLRHPPAKRQQTNKHTYIHKNVQPPQEKECPTTISSMSLHPQQMQPLRHERRCLGVTARKLESNTPGTKEKHIPPYDILSKEYGSTYYSSRAPALR